MATKLSHIALVMLAARGKVNPHLQLAWRNKYHADPVRVSYTVVKHICKNVAAVAGGIGGVAAAIINGTLMSPVIATLAPWKEAQGMAVVIPLLFSIVMVVLHLKMQKPGIAFSWEQMLFNERLAYFADKAAITVECVGEMDLQKLKETATRILVRDASEVLRHREDTKNFENEKNAEIVLSKDNRYSVDFELVPGPWDSFFATAKEERAAAKSKQAPAT
jgi:hypothetical protein